MIVCSCRAVTDRTVDASIASGAATVDGIAERCGAGGACGGCRPELERMLGAHDGVRVGIGVHAAA